MRLDLWQIGLGAVVVDRFELVERVVGVTGFHERREALVIERLRGLHRRRLFLNTHRAFGQVVTGCRVHVEGWGVLVVAVVAASLPLRPGLSATSLPDAAHM